MTYAKVLPICAAFAVCMTAVSGAGSPASAKGRPILINAPAEDEAITRRVSYADLNLAAASGERALTGRVKYAVNDLCSAVAGGSDGAFMFGPARARCARTTWDQARPQIDLAVQRAREIAATGHSSILAAALTLTAPAER